MLNVYTFFLPYFVSGLSSYMRTVKVSNLRSRRHHNMFGLRILWEPASGLFLFADTEEKKSGKTPADREVSFFIHPFLKKKKRKLCLNTVKATITGNKEEKTFSTFTNDLKT